MHCVYSHLFNVSQLWDRKWKTPIFPYYQVFRLPTPINFQCRTTAYRALRQPIFITAHIFFISIKLQWWKRQDHVLPALLVEYSHLVEVMIFLRLLKMKCWSLFLTCSCQEVIKYMVVPGNKEKKMLNMKQPAALSRETHINLITSFSSFWT